MTAPQGSPPPDSRPQPEARDGHGRRLYLVREIFYSLQGEGVRAGTPNVFVRLARCNLSCAFCDTDYSGGEPMTAEAIKQAVEGLAGPNIPVIWTGGEPTLQYDDELGEALKGHYQAMETNGTRPVTKGRITWITVSPKGPDSGLRQLTAAEVKYVMAAGDPLPVPRCQSHNLLLSPVHHGDRLDRDALDWCIHLCMENPLWRLSVQQHKAWGLR